MNKKGFELSTNMMVTMILMLVILGVGLTIFFKIKGQTEDLNDQVSADVQRMIEEEMINSGGTVVIPKLKETVDAGRKVAFSIGIENKLEQECKFKITSTLKSVVLQPGVSGEEEPKAVLLDNIVEIDTHERAFKRIFFDVPKQTPAGQYGFLVEVSANSNSDGTVCGGSSFTFDYKPHQMVYIIVR